MSLQVGVLVLSIIVVSEAQCVLPGARPNVSSGCYMFRETTKNSWEDAEADCRDLGGHLASVSSAEQNSELQGLVEYLNPRVNAIWLGLRDSDPPNLRERYGLNFTWSDGSDFTYSNWDYEEPKNHMYEVSMCAVMWTGTVPGTSPGKWTIDFCGQSNMYHPYFCKVPLAGNGSEIPVAGSARASSGVSDDAPAGKKPEAMPENGSKAPASSKATFVDGMEPSNGRNTLNETLGIKRTNPFVFNVSFNVTV